jgi:hypothetical protein
MATPMSEEHGEFEYQLNDQFQDGRYTLVGNLSHGSYGKMFLVHDNETNSQ